MPLRYTLLAAALVLAACNQTADKPATVPSETDSSAATAPTPETVESSVQPPPCGGKMCYEISDNKITIFNTPGEKDTYSTELDMPPDIISVKRQLMVYDKDGKTDLGPIEIQIDRTGVKSVSMKGKAISRKD